MRGRLHRRHRTPRGAIGRVTPEEATEERTQAGPQNTKYKKGEPATGKQASLRKGWTTRQGRNGWPRGEKTLRSLRSYDWSRDLRWVLSHTVGLLWHHSENLNHNKTIENILALHEDPLEIEYSEPDGHKREGSRRAPPGLIETFFDRRRTSGDRK